MKEPEPNQAGRRKHEEPEEPENITKIFIYVPDFREKVMKKI